MAPESGLELKDMTFGNKMRWVAGGLYGLLAVYQMYLVKPVLVGAPITNLYLTWIHAILLMAGAAVMSVWMFYGRENLSANVRRAVVAGSVFAVIFELMTYSDQADLINYAIYSVWPDQVNNTTLQYILMVLRLLLLILAAFFVTSAKEPDKKYLADEEGEETAEAEPEGDTDGAVEVIEIIEVVEAEAQEEPEEAEEAADAADEEATETDEAEETPAETDESDEDEEKAKDE